MLIVLAITSAGITMRTVQPNRSPIMALTGWLYRIDQPRSPVASERA